MEWNQDVEYVECHSIALPWSFRHSGETRDPLLPLKNSQFEVSVIGFVIWFRFLLGSYIESDSDWVNWLIWYLNKLINLFSFLPLGDSFDSLARRTDPNAIEPLLLLFIIDQSIHYSTLSPMTDQSINQSINRLDEKMTILYCSGQIEMDVNLVRRLLLVSFFVFSLGSLFLIFHEIEKRKKRNEITTKLCSYS